jgi:hypothetical protein
MSKSDDSREFFQQYVLNAARGAGSSRLNVAGAVREAIEAYELIEKTMREREAREGKGS